MEPYNKLVSRERECNELQRVMASDRSEFVIVYGRRRVFLQIKLLYIFGNYILLGTIM